MPTGRIRGRVDDWNRALRYGWIVPDDGTLPRIYVNHSDCNYVKGRGTENLKVNEMVTFEVIQGRTHWQALKVQIITDETAAQQHRPTE